MKGGLHRGRKTALFYFWEGGLFKLFDVELFRIFFLGRTERLATAATKKTGFFWGVFLEELLSYQHFLLSSWRARESESMSMVLSGGGAKFFIKSKKQIDDWDLVGSRWDG